MRDQQNLNDPTVELGIQEVQKELTDQLNALVREQFEKELDLQRRDDPSDAVLTERKRKGTNVMQSALETDSRKRTTFLDKLKGEGDHVVKVAGVYRNQILLSEGDEFVAECTKLVDEATAKMFHSICSLLGRSLIPAFSASAAEQQVAKRTLRATTEAIGSLRDVLDLPESPKPQGKEADVSGVLQRYTELRDKFSAMFQMRRGSPHVQPLLIHAQTDLICALKGVASDLYQDESPQDSTIRSPQKDVRARAGLALVILQHSAVSRPNQQEVLNFKEPASPASTPKSGRIRTFLEGAKKFLGEQLDRFAPPSAASVSPPLSTPEPATVAAAWRETTQEFDTLLNALHATEQFQLEAKWCDRLEAKLREQGVQLRESAKDLLDLLGKSTLTPAEQAKVPSDDAEKRVMERHLAWVMVLLKDF